MIARHPPSVAGIAVTRVVLALLFGILERIAPAIRGLSIWRWHRRIDFLYRPSGAYTQSITARPIATGCRFARSTAQRDPHRAVQVIPFLLLDFRGDVVPGLGRQE